MNGASVPRDPARRWDEGISDVGHVDDPRKDERLRMSQPDSILDRIQGHVSPADDDLPLAEAIRHHRELQEHARGAQGAA